MLFRGGYKYQLAANESFYTSFRPKETIKVPRITLFPDGMMTVHEGYSFDGATGTIDRRTNIRPSCGHDALYQLMRMGKLSFKQWHIADGDYCKWLHEAGAWPITVKLNRFGLRAMKGKYAHPSERKKIYKV